MGNTTNIASLLENSARRHPNRIALALGDTRLSYQQVDAASNMVANLLVARGIRPGDRVALSIPNLPHFSIVYYGILKAGAVVVPLNILLKTREIAYHLIDSGAVAYFAFEGSPELPIGQAAREARAEAPSVREFFLIPADPAAASHIEGAETLDAAVDGRAPTFDTVETDEDDTAVILYTSGTTGQPKGAELRHRNLHTNALAAADLLGSEAAEPDTYLGVLPLFHTFGQTVIQNGAFATGGTIVLLPRFEPKAALDVMLREKVTFFAGVPTMYWGLLGALDTGVDVSSIAQSLRIAIAGGSALPAQVHHEFRERFGVTILEGYGLSETSPVVTFSPPDQEPRVGSIGLPIDGVSVRLVDGDGDEVSADLSDDGKTAVGEIAVKGPNVFKGYIGRPTATANAFDDEGWFRTGDLARRDADGQYYIVDRAKDLIIRGGFNVYPREIEEVLMTHPAVSLVAVIGVPHETHGEEIKAVVLRSDGDRTTEDELLAWGKESLAAYKYPRILQFVDDLPLTSTGKILKRALS
ncbi:long-chain-fatty-acid--CoA ligase [Gordonia sp. NPDC003376]